MKKKFNDYKGNRLWIFILGIIIFPNVFEEIISRFFGFHFKNVIWYEIVDTAIFLVFAAPVFCYLIKKTDEYSLELKYQLDENIKVNDKLLLKNKELKYMATHDYLTGLPNRYKLFQTLDSIVAENKEFAVLFIDLDRFKIINDTMGHLSGDLFIKQVGQKLKELNCESNTVFRHGGDEFVILIEDADEEACMKFASDVIQVFSEPIYINNEGIYTTASIGISLYPIHGKDAESLIKKADKAMYYAKEHGGNKYHIYLTETDDDDVRKMKLENGLRTALENNQFFLEYQPLIELGTKQVMGIEALVRWNHPELGLVPPLEFIPIAEKTGAIIPIGKWVFETACRQVKDWQSMFNPNLCVSINVSVRQIKDKDFIPYVRNFLSANELEPPYVKLEITESMMQNSAESSAIFKQLKEIGVNISVDDFGTGYSSLSLLGFLPIDYLKIDQSFTKEMLTHLNIDSIVKTIIDMGHNLVIPLIAEGIETEEQEKVLMSYGCQYGQGYYYSKPLPVEEMELYMKR